MTEYQLAEKVIAIPGNDERGWKPVRIELPGDLRSVSASSIMKAAIEQEPQYGKPHFRLFGKPMGEFYGVIDTIQLTKHTTLLIMSPLAGEVLEKVKRLERGL